MRLITIITINYNQSQLIEAFLSSLNDFFPYENFRLEVIIVDNASKTEDVLNLENIIDEATIDVTLKKSLLNLGFGGGNMFGAQFATGDYLAFVNSDIVFLEDNFTPLVNFLNNTPNAAVCTPQQLNRDENPTSGFDYFQGIRKELFGRSLSELFLSKETIKRNDYPYQKNFQADFIQGCFMFFDAKRFGEVGGFDTNIFLYFEEMDICYRLRKRGYTSHMVPNSKFLHLHGASTSKSIHIRKELLLSRLYIYRKNYSFAKYKVLQTIIVIKMLFKSLFKWTMFPLFYIAFMGGHLKYSLKQKQQMLF